MSIVGGNVEIKDFIIDFTSPNGNFNKTSYDGSLHLKVSKVDNSGKPIYEEEGVYYSDIIDLKDKFKKFDKVVATFTNSGVNQPSSFTIETRSGASAYTLGEWVAVAPTTNEIKSTINRFIQVRFIFKSGYEYEDEVLSDFNSENDALLFNGNTSLIDTTNGLSLKRNHKIKVAKTFDWQGIGTLGTYVFKESEWRRFDSFRLFHESEV
ncbi:hypothetical protein ABNX05_18220 [Lysinibacillus sp. M3]|uniref:Uncharacterized protein n=1 Tax=Lysinibacillus zambalensis TaxID=3160866 RepID=A0ABV1MVL6_9BACI